MGGASVTFTAAVSPSAIDAGLGARGVDIRLLTPDYEAVYRRRPVDEAFCENLGRFLWVAASDFTPENREPYADHFAGITIQTTSSTDLTVTLEVEIVAHQDADGDTQEFDGINFETSRAALITASERIRNQVHSGTLDSDDARTAVLPLDLLLRPETQRLTGVYRLPTWLYDRGTLTVTHHIRYEELAEGELETSFLTSLLPLASVAAHGVDHKARPWAIVTQILPTEMGTSIGAPWNPVTAAREEITRGVNKLPGAKILSESIATRTELIDLIESRGVERGLIDDWPIEDLALAGIAELTNAQLDGIAKGRLTGCAFPEVAHDCPRDIFACLFTRWQEMLFLNRDAFE